jgi:hypothetical protein
MLSSMLTNGGQQHGFQKGERGAPCFSPERVLGTSFPLFPSTSQLLVCLLFLQLLFSSRTLFITKRLPSTIHAFTNLSPPQFHHHEHNPIWYVLSFPWPGHCMAVAAPPFVHNITCSSKEILKLIMVYHNRPIHFLKTRSPSSRKRSPCL